VPNHNCVFQMSYYDSDSWLPQSHPVDARKLEIEDDMQTFAGDTELLAHLFAEYRQISGHYA